jgi:hypothetical protein
MKTSGAAPPEVTEQQKNEILKLKLEIESLRSQNNMLQQKLLVSLSDHHSSRIIEQQSMTSTDIDNEPPQIETPPPSFPPEGFIEEGLSMRSERVT